jgi:hypothetical protein
MAKKEATVTSTLDPRWTARIYRALTGEDFLGLRAVQANITGYLLPGIITTTSRARYYSFYSWLLVEYGSDHPEGWSLARFIHRREQIFALANLAWRDSAPDGTGTGGLTGSNKLGNHWYKYRDAKSVPLSVDDYVRAPYGGYDVYSGVMRALRITRYPEAGGGLDVLPNGEKLAQAFTESIKDTRYYRNRIKYDTARSIPRTVLLEYGEHCHLSYLARSPDRELTQEVLFAFAAPDILPPIDSGRSYRGNMRGTLGMILDMIQHTDVPLEGGRFRECVTYGLCDDFTGYQPVSQLRPFVAHWQMDQLREYYVYALYALWAYFLSWLRIEGPQTLDGFCEHLNQSLDLSAVASQVGIELAGRPSARWPLSEWLDQLLDAAHTPGQDFHQRCADFAQQSQLPLKEHALYLYIRDSEHGDLSAYAGVSWLLLSALFLRLQGIKLQTEGGWTPWHWARAGGERRRSLACFVRDLSNQITAGASLLETLRWLVRDYIIAQHTITALEKWRQRNAKTFHFNYENGIFEWIQDDWTGFSAIRFGQAYTMLFDLGLYEIPSGSGSVPQLTALGKLTLQRVLESLNDQA